MIRIQKNRGMSLDEKLTGKDLVFPRVICDTSNLSISNSRFNKIGIPLWIFMLTLYVLVCVFILHTHTCYQSCIRNIHNNIPSTICFLP